MTEKSGKISRGGIIFLLVVMCLYALAFLVDTELALNALAFATRLFYQMLPVLLLVFALIFVSNLSFPKTVSATDDMLLPANKVSHRYLDDTR